MPNPPSISYEAEKDREKAASSQDVTLEDIEEYPSALNLVFMIIALILAMFLASLDFTIIGTAIPEITEKFQALDSVGIDF